MSRVSEKANTTRYMIRWYFNEEVYKEIALMNDMTRQNNLISKAVEAIDILTEGGNKIKMRELKRITSIRDYKVLKSAVRKYENLI